MTAYVGSYKDNFSVGDCYDLVYCFRSSWYFDDIYKALDFMLNKAAPSGVLIFDIMNMDSPWNRRMIIKKNTLFPITILKNFFKIILNLKFGVREIMYSPKMIENWLLEKKS